MFGGINSIQIKSGKKSLALQVKVWATTLHCLTIWDKEMICTELEKKRSVFNQVAKGRVRHSSMTQRVYNNLRIAFNRELTETQFLYKLDCNPYC